jgi:endonuclease IV
MKVGLKIYSSDPLTYMRGREFADYMEVLAVPGQSVDRFKDYDFEYIIHAPHVLYNVNLASKKNQQPSIQATRQALDAADTLNAKIVVVHPGILHNPLEKTRESFKTLKESLLKLKDKRIVLENCPYYDMSETARGAHLYASAQGKPAVSEHAQKHASGSIQAVFDNSNKTDDYYMGYDYKSLKQFSGIFGGRTCLDFSHAIATSIQLKKDYRQLIKGLLRFDVRLFHICDGIMASGADKHLPFFEGDYDLEYLKSIIKSSKCKRVTLETSMDLKKQKKEYEWMKQ